MPGDFPAAGGREQQLTFHDPRSPFEVAAQLEGDLMTVFRFDWDERRLIYRAAMMLSGVEYAFELLFAGALPDSNCYTLKVTALWAGLPAATREHARRSSTSWFEFWTRRWQAAPPPAATPAGLYHARAEESLAAESHLPDVAAIQQAILRRMRQGAHFFTAHKEGGTHIRFRDSRFVRADYGESDQVEFFETEAAFLAFLRKFYDWEVSRAHYPQRPPEFDAWKLILRLLRD